MQTVDTMRADDFCDLAAELASEHGDAALAYARRATVEFASSGAMDRAQFWYVLALFLDDIMSQRIDPELPLVFH
jgi:hypothetical protein